MRFEQLSSVIFCSTVDAALGRPIAAARSLIFCSTASAALGRKPIPRIQASCHSPSREEELASLGKRVPKPRAKRLSSRFTPEWVEALAHAGVPVCPHCRARNHVHAAHCSLCGVELGPKNRFERGRWTAPSTPAHAEAPRARWSVLCAALAASVLAGVVTAPLLGQGLALCLM